MQNNISLLLFLSDEENEKEEVGFTRNLYTIVGAIAFLAIFLSGGAILFTRAIKDLLNCEISKDQPGKQRWGNPLHPLGGVELLRGVLLLLHHHDNYRIWRCSARFGLFMDLHFTCI